MAKFSDIFPPGFRKRAREQTATLRSSIRHRGRRILRRFVHDVRVTATTLLVALLLFSHLISGAFGSPASTRYLLPAVSCAAEQPAFADAEPEQVSEGDDSDSDSELTPAEPPLAPAYELAAGWFGAHQAQDSPDVDALGGAWDFTTENSALWQASDGPASVVCSGFALPDVRRINPAIGLSLAIRPATMSAPELLEEEPTANDESADEELPPAAWFSHLLPWANAAADPAAEQAERAPGYFEVDRSGDEVHVIQPNMGGDEPSFDAILRLSLSVDGTSWAPAHIIDQSPYDNAQNGGYLYVEVPEEFRVELEQLQVRVEAVRSGGDIEVLLDSVFLSFTEQDEVNLELQPLDKEGRERSSAEGAVFRRDDKPVFRFKQIDPERPIADRLRLLGRDAEAPEDLVSVTVRDASGEPASDVDAHVSWEGLGPFGVEIWNVALAPSREMPPGRYTVSVVITDEYGNTTETQQDFLWGVLAINTHKSIYLPDETVEFAFAVLDEEGAMVCDADLTLRISGPSFRETLSTAGGEIVVNDECRIKAKTIRPDYEATMSLAGVLPRFQAGVYDMELTAVTQNGTQIIEDAFEVREAVPFDIERQGPTRILPTSPYEVTLTIQANEDFSGVIQEPVPESFAVPAVRGPLHVATGDAAGEVLSVGLNADDESEKIISWEADFEAGEIYEISYTFDAPDISPEFWLIGPLQLYDGPMEMMMPEAEEAQEPGISNQGPEDEEKESPLPFVEEVDAQEAVSPAPMMTASGTLRFAEIRQWQIAADVIVGYVEKAQSWNATTAGVWQDRDLSGAPFNVPANAVLEIAIANADDDIEYSAGVRASGSSLERRLTLHESEPPGGPQPPDYDFAVMHVQANENSTIESYAEDTTAITFYLLGYWAGGTYVEKFETFTAGADTTWSDEDLSAFGVSANQVAEVVMINNSDALDWEAGVRTNGSSLVRTVSLQEAESGGMDTATMLAVADNSMNATIEVYAESDANVSFRLLGYWTSAPGVYTETYQTITAPTVGTTWQDRDLSGAPFNVPGGAVVEVILANGDQNDINEFGVRENGSALERRLTLHEAEGGGRDAARLHANTDATSILEVYHSDVGDTPFEFQLIGYWHQDVTVGTVGTQATPLYITDTGQDLAAAFSIVAHSGTPDITSIKITENGTVDGQNDLDNIKLFYESDTSLPYDCASESYGGGETQYGATDTDGFSGADGTSTFTEMMGVSISTTSTLCVYVVLDIPATAEDGETIEIEIADPANDVVATSGLVGPGSAVALAGTTTLNSKVFVDASGTQVASVSIPTSDVDVQDTFRITNRDGSHTVTGMTITENGLVNAKDDLDNIRLYYDLDTSAPYDCASESFSGFPAPSESQFGATDTDGFSGADGTSAFSDMTGVSITTTQTMCVYVILDVLSGAVDNQTIELSIADADSDVTVTGGGTVGPNASVAMPGTTFLQGTFLIRGTVYQDEGSTPLPECDGMANQISLRIGGTTYGTTCNSSTGEFEFTGVTEPMSAGTPAVLWIDGVGSTFGTTVTRYDNGSLLGVDIYENRVIASHDDAGPVTNSDFDTYDTNDDGDIVYDVTGGTLTVESGIELHISQGKSFDPGGDVDTNTTGGDVHVADNATMDFDTAGSTVGRDLLVDGGATVDVQANTTVSGGDITTSGTGATLTYTGTPTLTVNGTGSIGGGTTPSFSFYNLTLGGTITMASATDTDNDLTVNGTMQGGASVTTTVNGSFAGTGTVNMTGGTVEQVSQGTETFGTTSGANDWTFEKLTFGTGGGGLLVFDSFTDTDSTAITAHTPDTGIGWTSLQTTGGGSGVITTNQLTHNGTSANAGYDVVASPASPSPNYYVEATAAVIGSGDDPMRLLARVQDANNFYAFEFSDTAGNTELQERTGGAWSTLNGACGTVASTDTVRLEVIGTSITAYVNGSVACSAVDGTHSAAGQGGVGMGAFRTGNNDLGAQQMDDVTIQTLPSVVDTNTGGSGDIIVNGQLAVSKSGDAVGTVLEAGNRTWELANTNELRPFEMDNAGGSLTPETSTFFFSGDNDSGAVAIEDAAYNNVTLGNSVIESYNFEGAVIVQGDLTLNANATLADNDDVTVNGSATGAGTITLTGGTFLMRVAAAESLGTTSGTNDWTFSNLVLENSSGANQTITAASGGTGDIIVSGTATIGNAGDTNSTTWQLNTNDRDFDVNGAGGVNITSQGIIEASDTASFTNAGNWNNDNGTATGIVHNNGEIQFDGAGGSTQTIGDSNTFFDLTITTSTARTITFEASQTQTIGTGGSATFTGASGELLTLQSSVASTDWNFSIGVGDTRTVDYTAGIDANATSDSISATNSSCLRTINWTCDNNTVSGIAYEADGSTPLTECDADGMTNEISLRVNATTYNASCDDTTGAFTFTGVNAPTIGDPMVLWINGVTSTFGTTASRNNGSVGGLNVWQDTLILRHEDSGPIDNSDLATWDQDNDSDIVYTANGAPAALSVNSGIPVRINADDTYEPGGTVATAGTGDLIVEGGATFTATDAVTITGGDITTEGTSAAINYTGTPTVTLSGNGSIGGGTTPSITFYNLTLSNVTTIASAITVENDLTVNGTMNGTGNVTINGSFAGTGTVSMTGGTVEQRVAGTETFGATMGSSTWTFNNLSFSGDAQLFFDSFTDTDGTLIQNHTPDTLGTGWTNAYSEGSGNGAIDDNKLHDDGVGADGDGFVAIADDLPPSPDYRVEIEVNQGDTDDDVIILVARWQDSNNTYAFRFSQSTASTLLLVRSGGAWTTLSSSCGSATTGDTVALEVNGTTIRALKNGTEVCSATDSTISAAGQGGVGHGAFYDSADDLDLQRTDRFSISMFPKIDTNTGGSGDITVAGQLLVSKTGDSEGLELLAGNRIWRLTNTNQQNPFNTDQAGGILTAETSTFVYSGDNDSGVVAIEDAAYNNLTLGGAVVESYDAEGATSVLGDLLINANATLVGADGWTVNGSATGAGTITLTGGTFLMRVAAAESLGTTSGTNDWTFSNLVLENSSGANQTITAASGGTGDIIVSGTATIGNAGDTNSTTWQLNTNDRDFDVNGAGGVNITSQGIIEASDTASFTNAGNWNNDNGTATGIVHNNGEIQFDGAGGSTQTINDANTWFDLTATTSAARTIQFENAVTQTIVASGTLTFTGASGQLLTLDTTDPADDDWDIDVAATASYTVDFTSALDADATGVMGQTISATNSSCTRTINWNCGIVVSGTAYQDEGINPLPECNGGAGGDEIAMRAGGTTYTTSCDASTGDFIFPSINEPAGGSAVTLWIDGGIGAVATSVTRQGGGSLDIDLYENRLILRHEDAGPITNSDLSGWDQDDDGDIVFTANGMTPALSTDSGVEIHIWANDEFQPGGTVATSGAGGDVHIEGGGIFDVDDTVTVAGGDITTAGTAAVVQYTGTPTVTVNGTGQIGGGTNPSVTFYNLVIGGTATMASATDTDNDLTVNGTMQGSASVTTEVNGTINGTGIVNMTGGTVEQRIAAAENFGTTGGVNNWTFNNLTFSNSDGAGGQTVTAVGGGTGDIIVNGRLLVSLGADVQPTTLDAGSRTWTLANVNEANPFDLDGTSGVLTANGSTFAYTGDNDAGNVTIEDATYNNLTLGGSVAENYDAEAATTVTGDLLMNANGTLIGTDGWTLNGSATGAGTITLTGGTFLMRVGANETLGTTSGINDWTFTGLTLENSSGANQTITMASGGSGDLIVSQDLTIGNAGDTNTTTLQQNTNDRVLDINDDLLVTTQGVLEAASAQDALFIAGDWTRDGTFNHNSGEVTFDGAGATTQTINDANTFFDLTITTSTARIITFEASQTQAIAAGGSATFTGVSGQLLTLQSSVASTDWNFSIGAMDTRTVNYTAGIDANATSDSINALNSTCLRTTNWTCAVDFDGFVYSDEGTTALPECNDGAPADEIALRLEGTTYTTSCSSTDGSFSFTGIPGPAADAPAIFWIDGIASTFGTTAVRSNGGASGIHLYENTLIVRHESATAINNADLAVWDSDDDTDIVYTANGMTPALLTESGIELHIWGGDTFDPGGDVDTDVTGGNVHVDDNAHFRPDDAGTTIGADLLIDDSATVTADASFTISGGDITTSGTGAALTYTGSPAVTVNGTGSIGGGTTPSLNFYNLIIGGTVTMASATDTDNDLTINGTMQGSASVITLINGTINGTGTVNMTGGTVEQRSGSNESFGTTGGTNDWTFSNLTFSNSGGGGIIVTTDTGGSGDVIVAGTLLVSKSGDSAGTTLRAGNRTWTLSSSNNGAPFNLDGAGGVLTAQTSTFEYTGDNDSGNVTIEDATYTNLTAGGAVVETYNTENPVTVTGDLTVNANATLSDNDNITLNGSATGAGTITMTGGTFLMRVGANETLGTTSGINDWTFENLTLENADAAAPHTITMASGGSGDLIVSQDLTIGRALDDQTTTLQQNTNDRVLDVNDDLLITSQGILEAASAADSLFIAGDWTRDGTFNHNSGEVTFDGAGATTQTINDANTFFDLTITTSTARIITFEASQTQAIAAGGSATFTGVSGQLLTLQSSVASTDWNFFIGAMDTRTVNYTAGIDANATNDSVNADNSTCLRTTNWTCGIDVDGFVYSDEGSTALPECDADGMTDEISLRMDGTTYTASCDDATGAFSFSGLNAPAIGTPMVLWINTGVGAVGTTVSRNNGSSSDMNIYENTLIVRHDDAGPTTILDLDTYDNNNDGAIVYTATDAAPDTLSVESGIELHIWDGSTFDPDGDVDTNTTGGDVHVGENATMIFDTATSTIGGDLLPEQDSTTTFGADTTIEGGDITMTGTGIVIDTTGTPTVTMNATGTISGGTTPSVAFYDLTIASMVTTTISQNIGVTHNLTVTGTMDGTSDVEVNGDVAGTGTISMTGGTFEQRVAADENFGATSGSVNWTFNNLTFSNSDGAAAHTVTTQTGGTGEITISGQLLVSLGADSQATTLNAGNRTWNLTNTNSANPFDMDGTSGSLIGNTSTFEYEGDNDAGNVTVENASYNNLTLGGSVAENYDAEGAITVGGDLSVLANATLIGADDWTVNGSATGAGTVTLSGGTFLMRVAADETLGTTSGANHWTFNNLTLENSDTANHTVTAASTGTGEFRVSNDLTIGGTLDTNSTTLQMDTNDRILDVNNNVSILSTGVLEASSAAAFTVAGDWANAGTFNHNSGEVELDGAGGSTQTVTGANSWFDLTATTSSARTIQFQNAVTQTIVASGTLTFTGASGQLLTLQSSAGGGDPDDWDIAVNAMASYSVSYTSGFDIDASGGQTVNATNSSCTRTTNWNCNITIQGIAYQDEGTTALPECQDGMGAGGNEISIYDGTSTTTQPCSSMDGSFSFTISDPGIGTPLTLWINNGVGAVATTVTRANGGVSDMHLYENTLIVRHEDSGPLAIADMGFDDDTGDTDIVFNDNSGNLIVESGIELHVWDGATYDPGGDVDTNTTGGDVHVDDNATMYFDTATSTVGRDLLVDASASVQFQADTTISGGDITMTGAGITINTTGTPTVTMNATGSISGGTTPSVAFYDLTIGNTFTTTISQNITVTHNLTVTGTMDGTSDVEVNGDFIGAGTVDMSGGTVEQRVAAGELFGTGSGANNWTFNNLTFSNSSGAGVIVTTQAGGSGGILIDGRLLVSVMGDSAGTTLRAGSRAWRMNSTNEADPFDVDGAGGVLVAQTSQFRYSNDNDSGNVTIENATYNNLTIGAGVAENYDAEGPVTVTGDLDIGTNATLIGADDWTVSGSATGDGTVNLTGGTFLMRVVAPAPIGPTAGNNWTFNNLTLENSDVADREIRAAASGMSAPTLAVSGNVTVGNAGDTNNVVFNLTANDRPFDVEGDVTITTRGVLQASDTASFTVAGSWSNAGTFTDNGGAITFDSDAGAETIDTGGTGAGQDFNDVQFNHASGDWTLETNDIRVNGDFDLTAANSWTLQSGRLLHVSGDFQNDVGGAATTWTGTTLRLDSGTVDTLNVKTVGDVYATLDVDTNTDVRLWGSNAGTWDIDATSSAYSQDHDEASDGAGDDGKLFIYNDWHTETNEYWSYATDFDGAALGGSSRQVTVNIESGAGNGVTVDAGDTLEVIGGGGGANQYTIIDRIGGAGTWLMTNNLAMGAEQELYECSLSNMDLQAGVVTAINCDVNGNGNVVSGGTFNVDWYTSVHVLDSSGGNLDTAEDDAMSGDVIISENSGAPAATVWRHDGAGWGTAATSQRTGTGVSGHIPQPNTAGAIKIRERAETSGGNTFYLYNLQVEAQACCGPYNYFGDEGANYVTSALNVMSGHDEVIDDNWWRNAAIATENTHPMSAGDPPASGTWLAQLPVSFTFTLSGLSVDLGTLGNTNSWTNDGVTVMTTVTTGSSNGYQLTAWARQLLTGLNSGDTIPMWTGTNAAPTTWDSTCPGASECGFGYSTDDNTLAGGTVDRFTAAGCGPDGQCWAGFPTSGPGDLVSDDTAPVTDDDTVIEFRVSADPGGDAADDYETQIVFIATPQY